MESAVINAADPADKVLVVSAGYFGERWVELAIITDATSYPCGTSGDGCRRRMT